MEVAELLRQTGYDTTTVLEQDLGGSADTDLAPLCQKERRVFVTGQWNWSRQNFEKGRTSHYHTGLALSCCCRGWF